VLQTYCAYSTSLALIPVLQNYSASAGNWLTQLASGWPDRTEEKKLVSKFGYKVINRIADVEIPKNTGDFRLMSRRMVDQISSWIWPDPRKVDS